MLIGKRLHHHDCAISLVVHSSLGVDKLVMKVTACWYIEGLFINGIPCLPLCKLLGIVLSCVFWNLLVDMSESPDMVDFKLKKSEFDYSELDLAGAGWCMCLPRDGGYFPVPESDPVLDPIDVHLEKLKKQPPRTHSQLRELQQSRSATGLDEVDVGRKQKREHWVSCRWGFCLFFLSL